MATELAVGKTETPLERAGWGDELRAVYAIGTKTLLVELRLRNKFALDLIGHVLGLLPVVLTAWALSGGRDSSRLGELAGISDHFTFVVIGFVAFSALGVGSTLMLYTGSPYAVAVEQQLGVLERNLVSPIRKGTLLIGHSAYFTALFAYHSVTLFLFAWLIFGLDISVDLQGAVFAVLTILSLLLMSVALGVIGASINLAFKEQDVFLLVISRPMVMLSGAYFLIELIPQPFKVLAMVNPVAYVVDAFRGSLTGVTLLTGNVETAVSVAFALAVGLLLVSVPVYRRLFRKMEVEGTLGLF